MEQRFQECKLTFPSDHCISQRVYLPMCFWGGAFVCTSGVCVIYFYILWQRVPMSMLRSSVAVLNWVFSRAEQSLTYFTLRIVACSCSITGSKVGITGCYRMGAAELCRPVQTSFAICGGAGCRTCLKCAQWGMGAGICQPFAQGHLERISCMGGFP